MNSVWGQDTPCPDGGCPKPAGWWMSLFYRRRLWVCPLCCYGWAYQDHPQNPDMYRLRRTDKPVPFHRPGRKELRP